MTNWSTIQTVAMSVAEQNAESMSGLARKQSTEQLYVFALVVADDFATVSKATNSESYFQKSEKSVYHRWGPSQWFATGMEIDTSELIDLLGDPTYQIEPKSQLDTSRCRAAWLASLVEGLRVARKSGHLNWFGKPMLAFVTVEDCGLAGWLAIESARMLNSQDAFELVESTFTKAWDGWDSDEDSEVVQVELQKLWALERDD